MASELGEAEFREATEDFGRRTEIVEKGLSPKTEIDQAGFKRHIYQLNGVAFSFRGREELTEYEVVKTSKTLVIGSTPVHTDNSEYAHYLERANTAVRDEKPTHILATKDVEGVIELAIKLGASEPGLPKMLAEVKNGIYSGRTLDLIDQLVAVNCIDDKGEWSEIIRGGDSEALVLLSLLGNSEARDYIDYTLDQEKNLDHQLAIKRKGRERVENGRLYRGENDYYTIEDDGKNPKDLISVHATSYKPQLDKDGVYEVKTTADATGFKFVRNTIHVAVNHKVMSHMMGSWNEAPYVILSPMDQMISMNGTPASYQEWDTWWTRNPGETLKFPHGYMVQPGTVPFNTLFVIGERSATFKGNNYTVDDFSGIEKVTGHDMMPVECFQQTLKSLSDEIEEEADNLKDWNPETFSQKFIEKYFPNETYQGERSGKSYLDLFKVEYFSQEDTEAFNLMFSEHSQLSLADKVKDVLESAGIKVAYRGDPESYNKNLLVLSKHIANQLEGRIYESLSDYVVQESIRKLGYKPTGGGNYPSAHAESPYNWITRGHAARVDDAKEILGENPERTKNLGRFDWKNFNTSWGQLPEVDLKTRRVVYASGAFNSREV